MHSSFEPQRVILEKKIPNDKSDLEIEETKLHQKATLKKTNMLHKYLPVDDYSNVNILNDAIGINHNFFQDEITPQQDQNLTLNSSMNPLNELSRNQDSKIDLSYAHKPTRSMNVQMNSSVFSPERTILPAKFLKDQVLWDLDQNSRTVFGQPNMRDIKTQIRKSQKHNHSTSFSNPPDYEEILKKKF